MLRLAVIAVLLAATLRTSLSQSPTPLNNQSLIKMHEAGMSDDLIVTAINTQRGAYDSSMDGLLALKGAGIDEQVLQAMLLRGSAQDSYRTSAATADASAQSGLRKPRVLLVSHKTGKGLLALLSQNIELSKNMEHNCPAIQVTVNRRIADYTVSVDRTEAGLFRDTQFQLTDRNGDVLGTSTKGGASVAAGIRLVCSEVLANWEAHSQLPATRASITTPALAP